MAGPREVVVDIAEALKKVFDKHAQANSRKAWKTITSKEGKEEVDKLIVNPKRSIAPFRSIPFKEWVDQQS